VLIRVTPKHKKSITQEVQLYNVPVDQSGHRSVAVSETYRWGHGYREGDDMNWPYIWQGDQIYCDSTIGPGADLDDLCSVDFNYDGEWTDEQKEDFEDKWYNGDSNDDDGRSGMAWLFDYQGEWNVEEENLIINGPYKFDVIDKDEYGKIYIEDWQPPVEESTEEKDNG